MGLTHVPVTVSNLITGDSFTANFLIDTGYTESMIPASALRKIGIEPEGKRTYELANGQLEDYEIGFAAISFLDERIAGQVLFGPENAEPLLGVISLEAAGIVVDPKNQSIRKLPALPLK